MSILDDTAYIGARAKLLHNQDRGVCMKRVEAVKAHHDCWCYLAGPGGLTLPCPPENPTGTVVKDVPARGPLFGDLPVPWYPGAA